MKKQRALRPVLQELEDRTVMSFSFSHLLHSVFPFIHSNTDTKTSSKTAAQMTAAQRSDLIQTRWDARTAAATQASANGHILSSAHTSIAKIHSQTLQQFLDRHQVAQPNSTTTLR